MSVARRSRGVRTLGTETIANGFPPRLLLPALHSWRRTAGTAGFAAFLATRFVRGRGGEVRLPSHKA
jgi:hypothetical protein